MSARVEPEFRKVYRIVDDSGEDRLVRRVSFPRNQGLVDWFLACPEKDFFVPIETELTDTL